MAPRGVRAAEDDVAEVRDGVDPPRGADPPATARSAGVLAWTSDSTASGGHERTSSPRFLPLGRGALLVRSGAPAALAHVDAARQLFAWCLSSVTSSTISSDVSNGWSSRFTLAIEMVMIGTR